MRALGLRVVAVALLLFSIGLGPVGCASPTASGVDDDAPPATVTDLTVSSFTDTTATLTWTATGDDENDGTAARYELRRSDQFITPATWEGATVVPDVPAPQPAGSPESFTVTGLAPETRYFFALSTFDDEGNTYGCGNCVQVVCFQDAEVAFADSSLAAAVREELALPAGPIYRSQLRTLVSLHADSRGIADLGGIEDCMNLVDLSLQGNLIDDLTPLAGLAQISHLSLVSNEIDDLTPLAGLTQLCDLSVAGNDISDLSPLAGLAGLSHLWADFNNVSNLTPLAGLHELTVLRIENNAVSDLTPVTDMIGLEWLAVGGNAIADTSPLEGLTALETLQMNSTGLTDIGFVAGLPVLATLHVAVNQITDLTPVSGLTQLEYLQVSYNLIVDIAPLVANMGLGEGDTVLLRENPLSATALDEQIPALTARGVTVQY